MTAARRAPAVPAPVAGFGLIALAVYATAIVLVQSPLFSRAPDLASLAITLDLTVFVPLFFYSLVVRKTRVPAAALAPFFLLSLFAASLVLPADGERYLDVAMMAVIPAELALLAFVAVQARRAARDFGALEEPGVPEKLKATLRRVVPNDAVSAVVACEFASLYYAFLSWRARPEVGASDLAFTYHRKNGYVGLLGAAVFISAVEMAVVHLLLVSRSPVLAWTLFAVSAYGIVWMIGLVRSVLLRPITLGPDALTLRAGMIWSVRLPYSRIASVKPAARGMPKRAPGYLQFVSTGAPQLVLETTEPVVIDGLYGYRKKGIERIGLFVDDLPRFRAELEMRMQADT